MKVAVIELRIQEAVRTVRRFGFRLVADQRWGVEHQKGGWLPSEGEKEVCICGAIALAENPQGCHGVLSAVAQKLGISWKQADSLSDGFEGFSYDESVHDRAWFRIGRKFRRRADEVRN